jgi:hypothetical protein
MQEEKDLIPEEKDERTESTAKNEPPETAEHPIASVKHENEPDAENIMPVEDGPGTF